MGGSWGITSYRHDDAFDAVDTSVDDRDSSVQIFGGYRLLKYFAVEGRFSDLGDYMLTTDEVSVSFEFTAWSLHAVGIYPFGGSGFDLYGELGVGTVAREIKYREGDGLNDSENTRLIVAGGGLRYTPPKLSSMTVLLGYDWYRFDVRTEDDGRAQGIHVTKIGLQYNF